MKVHWTAARLGEVCNVRRGTTITQKQAIPGHIPVVGGGIEPTYTHNIPNRPGNIITVSGSGANAGFVNFYAEPIFASDCSTIEPVSNDLDVRYVYYFLQSLQSWINAKLRQGAAQPHVYARDLANIPIDVPSPPEQRRIVAILDEAFEAIAMATANAETNFVNSKKFLERYINYGFADMARRFPSRKIGEVVALSRGQNPPKNKFSRKPADGYVRFYQIRDGSSDAYVVYVPDSPQLHRVVPDDILMVAYRHVGRVFRGADGAFNVALCKISNLNRNVMDDDYLFYLLPTEMVRGELLKLSERSLIPSMSVYELADIAIPVPPVSEQRAFVVKLNSVQSESRRLESVYEKKLTSLNMLRSSILARAFSGKLTFHSSNALDAAAA